MVTAASGLVAIRLRRKRRGRYGLARRNRNVAAEPFDGAPEVEVKDVTHERYVVAADAAAAAIPDLLADVDAEPIASSAYRARAGPFACANAFQASAEGLRDCAKIRKANRH